MLIVTGGAGFIGSNIVKGLNQKGFNKIIVVDDLTDGRKFKNLVDSHIEDYIDYEEFLAQWISNPYYYGELKALFHQGACSATTEWNGRYMMKNNYDYSKKLLQAAQQLKIPFIYASSAAVYGASQIFQELPEYEKPLNVYGYSKLLFDQYVRRMLPHATAPVVGLRYFNVYGPGEAHKDSMASVAYHNHLQVLAGETLKLFEGSDGYGPGEQRRDFIYVGDVVKVNLWFLEQGINSGIFNVGTGNSQTFKEISESVIHWHQRGKIEYIPFPEQLKGRYQSFTQADISALKAIGYEEPFFTVQQGVKAYLDAVK